MNCILCFSPAAEDERLSVHDRVEPSSLAPSELIDFHFKFSEVNFDLISKQMLKLCFQRIFADTTDAGAWICNSCWTHLETFHDFHEFVCTNYSSEIIETKDESFRDSDILIYEGEEVNNDLEHVTIKDETINEPVNTEAEWLEEVIEEYEEPIKPHKKISSLTQPKISKPTSITLDSADDQRIRETAKMFCDICHDPLDSLRDAKSHYKNSHSMEGYITCCQR